MDAKWRIYQEEAANFFRNLGFKADTDVTINGQRSKHKVDVLVKLSHFGISTTWVIECKQWKRPIPKEKILTLRGVVIDIGADKGILLSESGFQPGAHSSASQSNVILSSLSELKSLATTDLENLLLQRVYRDIKNLYVSLGKLGKHEVKIYIDPEGKFNGYSSSEHTFVTGQLEHVLRLQILLIGLEQAISSDVKSFLCGFQKGLVPEYTTSKSELIQRGNELLSDAAHFYSSNAGDSSHLELRIQV